MVMLGVFKAIVQKKNTSIPLQDQAVTSQQEVEVHPISNKTEAEHIVSSFIDALLSKSFTSKPSVLIHHPFHLHFICS